jgi:hypothetical protein
MGLLTFSINVTLDGCVDHQEGIADDEIHAPSSPASWTRAGRCCGAASPTEMMESDWPAVARGDEEAPPAMREWAVRLEAKPKFVVSSTRKDFPWANSHHIAGDLRAGVQKLKDATPAGVLLGSGKLATEPDRFGRIPEPALRGQPPAAGQGMAWPGRASTPATTRRLTLNQAPEGQGAGYSYKPRSSRFADEPVAEIVQGADGREEARAGRDDGQRPDVALRLVGAVRISPMALTTSSGSSSGM